MALPGYVVPGQVIVNKTDEDYSKYTSGTGTEYSDRGITAMILGKVVSSQTDEKKWKIDIINQFRNPYEQIPTPPTGNSKRGNSLLPQVGDIVYARVLRLTQQQVVLEIIATENKGNVQYDTGVGQFASNARSVHGSNVVDNPNDFDEGYGAIIRIQDIRASEREKLKTFEQFAPGDLVRASVLSLGDESNYYLTTARNDLGVIFARNTHTGTQLIPLDWQTMVDQNTGKTYSRKCANPFVDV